MRVRPISTIAAMAALLLSTVAAPAKAQLPPRPEDATPAVSGNMPTIVTSPATPQNPTPPRPAPTIAPEYAYPTPVSTTPLMKDELWAAPPPTPSKHVYTKCRVNAPLVAISFDDGPHPTLTPKLLDLLKARGVKATFYVIGKNVTLYPEIVRRMIDEGHEVGNHTWSHPSLTKLSSSAVEKEIQSTTKAIVDACGTTPTTMRPPYGATNSSLNKRMAEEFGLPVILWSVDPQDWKIRRASHVSNHLIQHASPGDILLAHDIHPSTVEAMPATLDALIAKGYKFATVTELLHMDELAESTPLTH